jgi:hypothetical protein
VLIFAWIFIKVSTSPFLKLKSLKQPNYIEFYSNAWKNIFDGFKINPKGELDNKVM